MYIWVFKLAYLFKVGNGSHTLSEAWVTDQLYFFVVPIEGLSPLDRHYSMYTYPDIARVPRYYTYVPILHMYTDITCIVCVPILHTSLHLLTTGREMTVT